VIAAVAAIAGCGAAHVTTDTVTVTRTVVKATTSPAPAVNTGGVATEPGVRKATKGKGRDSGSTETKRTPGRTPVTKRARHFKVPPQITKTALAAQCRLAPPAKTPSASGPLPAKQFALQLLARVASLQHSLQFATVAPATQSHTVVVQLDSLANALGVLREDLAIELRPSHGISAKKLDRVVDAVDSAAAKAGLPSCTVKAPA
jgi:hypothetical protein